MKLLSKVLIILSDGTRAIINLIVSGTYAKDQLAGELDIVIRKLVLFRTNNFIMRPPTPLPAGIIRPAQQFDNDVSAPKSVDLSE